MIVKEFFDVVIIGTSLAPLTAGALLSRRGLRVLVVGNDELHHDNAALLFNTLTSDLAMRIFEELGVTHMVKRKVRRPSPFFQVILPEARIDVDGREEVFEREIAREFPLIAEDVKLLRSMLPEMMEGMERVLLGEPLLPPDGLIEKKKIDLLLAKTVFKDREGVFKYCGKVLHDPGFSCFIKAVAATHSFLDQKDLHPASFLFLHKRKVDHCAVFEGGLKALKQILFDRINAYGGEVRSRETIEEVALQGKKVSTIRLAGKESLIGCDFILSGIESECLNSMLRVDGRAVGRDVLRSEDLKPAGFLITTNLKVEKEVIPEPMASNIIVVFDCARPLRESNFLWAEIDDMKERSGREVKRVSLHYILDRESLTGSHAYSKVVLDGIVKNLGSVIPYFENFIIECVDPVGSIMKSHFTEDPMIHISRLMPTIHEYQKAAAGPFVGLGHKTGIRNIYRVNSEVCPSLGEDGLWLGGLGAAKIITSLRKGKTRLRRRIMFS